MGDYRDPDDSEADEPEWVKDETKKFKEEYDKNHDGKLDKDEVGKYVLCTWLSMWSNREIAAINTDYPTLCVCKIRVFF